MSFINNFKVDEKSSVKVAVRVRPFNDREKNTNSIVDIKDNDIFLINPETKTKKKFTFDYLFDHNDNQEKLYNNIGKQVINNTYQGYNSCVFAYGLTGSGKTFSMMGDHQNPGLIPRICQNLFICQSNHNNIDTNGCKMTYRVELSYLEIYSENVMDLLGLEKNKNLKIRQHPIYGPYVEELTQIAVEDYQSIKNVIDQGNKARHVASTLMNNRSSRSHAILTIQFTQMFEESSGVIREVVSKINLVDLAGSERVEISGVTGVNFKEAIMINKSLSTLGLVISKLAEKSNKNKRKKYKSDDHIPFRDSSLTWILKESLGGNSKTYMIAAISPSSINYNETLSTLRYASNAKQIVNTVKVNEDPNEKIIKVLHEEIDLLKEQINKANKNISNTTEDLSPEIIKLNEELKQREELARQKEKSWSSKLEESQLITKNITEQLKNVNKEKELLLNQVTEMKANIIDQEILQQSLLEQELAKQKEEFDKKQKEFEQIKIVETAVSLQEYYEKKIESIKNKYENKEKSINIIDKDEFDKLKKENTNLKNQLVKLQKNMDIQINRFTNERAILSKQIQQLTSKIHMLESLNKSG